MYVCMYVCMSVFCINVCIHCAYQQFFSRVAMVARGSFQCYQNWRGKIRGEESIGEGREGNNKVRREEGSEI